MQSSFYASTLSKETAADSFLLFHQTKHPCLTKPKVAFPADRVPCMPRFAQHLCTQTVPTSLLRGGLLGTHVAGDTASPDTGYSHHGLSHELSSFLLPQSLPFVGLDF